MSSLQPTLPFSGRSNAPRERSRRAAEKAAKRVSGRKRLVLQWLAARGDYGSTDPETIDHFIHDLHIPTRAANNGVRNRRQDCEKAGWVRRNGEERDNCTVYVITPLGRAELAL